MFNLRKSPHLETLEDRFTPTTVTFANGVLTITGNNNANTVTITQDDKANTLAVKTEISYDGWSHGRRTYASSKVHTIKVDLQGGNDTFTWDLQSNLLHAKSLKADLGQGDDTVFLSLGGSYSPRHIKAPLSIDLVLGPELNDGNDAVYLWLGQVDKAAVEVAAKLGGGDDTFEADLMGDLKKGADVHFHVLGQDGVDDVGVVGGFLAPLAKGGQAKVPCNVNAGATLDVSLGGGNDADTVGLYYYGKVDGLLKHHLEGGEGADIVLPMIADIVGSKGKVMAY